MVNHLKIQVGDNYQFTILSYLDLGKFDILDIFSIDGKGSLIQSNLKKHGFCYDSSYLYWKEDKISLLEICDFLKKNQDGRSHVVSEVKNLGMIQEYLREEKIVEILK